MLFSIVTKNMVLSFTPKVDIPSRDSDQGAEQPKVEDGEMAEVKKDERPRMSAK